MITGKEAQMSLASCWPREAQFWLNSLKEPDRPQTPAEVRKSTALIEVLADLREQSEAGRLNERKAIEAAVSRLIGIKSPEAAISVRRDPEAVAEARSIVYAIIRDNPEKKAVQSRANIPQGLQPSQFE